MMVILCKNKFSVKYCGFCIENEIDGDAFVLLTKDAIKEAMIHKQDLLLKFKKTFGELTEKVEIMSVIRKNVSDSRKSCSTSTSEDEVCQSSSTISVSERMNRQPAMSLDVIKELSKIYERYKVEPKLAIGRCIFDSTGNTRQIVRQSTA